MQKTVRENLERVRTEIAEAARLAGRSVEEICLVGVSKYVDAAAARSLIEAGCADLGESRPQELWTKAETLAECQPRWHQIGHLQRNKVRRTLPLVELIHAGDSRRLLEAIDREAESLGLRPRVLLEVNISGEPAKHGFSPEELRRELTNIARLEHLHVSGLMAMASLEGGANQARKDFAAVRELSESLRLEAPPNIELTELSIGMSHDFSEAILEGATIVRVGSALWEGVLP